MIDPRREGVLINAVGAGDPIDKTSEIESYQAVGSAVNIVFRSSPRVYSYAAKHVRILHNGVQVALPAGGMAEVRGQVWASVTDLWMFATPGEQWSRVFYSSADGERYATFPAPQVRLLSTSAEDPQATKVLRYWRDIVACLEGEDPLRWPYEVLTFINPGSVLGSYLSGAPVQSRELATAPIFPFRCNVSQRSAVELGLTRSMSVIEGPPGTGKTETILNLIANILLIPGSTVGVVSFANSAVDNVSEKLEELGFGHVVANLGAGPKRDAFFKRQEKRNAHVARFMVEAPATPPTDEHMADVDLRLRRLQEAERERAELRAKVAAYELEAEHFHQHLQGREVPDLKGLPLLLRSSDRILEYLAETQVEGDGHRPRITQRIRKYFRYGSTRGFDPDETRVVLGLQKAFYEKRLGELKQQVERLEGDLRRHDLDGLKDQHQQLSIARLSAALHARYAEVPAQTYREQTYTRGNTFAAFTKDYPVVLSTCHSLRRSIATEHLLDFLIIDEASQVNILAAGLALSSCRNLIVVGDSRQLPQIASKAARRVVAPIPAYDYQRHNILSSVIELYGANLPRTLLREHYRSHPAIIGFCNKSFYDGQLIPFTSAGAERPMIVWRTVEGNHMRQHHDGGRSNQREVDVICSEVIPTCCRGVAPTEIGITTPYRRQADKVVNALIDDIQADTVHKFQGRQKQVVILTTVLDEGWRGSTGLKFVDDPRLINVAVSRAASRFILVTNHDLLSKSHYIRNLIGYIRYQSPDQDVENSTVVSVFDLLYREYSQVLRPLATRLTNGMAYRSEEIVWAVLQSILGEQRYEHLMVGYQVLLQNLLGDVVGLTPPQAALVRHRSSVDFVVYNRVTNQAMLVIEVDGFAFHENNPTQLARDAIKDEILRSRRMPLLRLATTGSDEDRRIRAALDAAQEHWTTVPMR